MTLDPYNTTVDPDGDDVVRQGGPKPVPRIEILFHYDLSRIGLVTEDDDLLTGPRGASVGRDGPTFIQPSECARSTVNGRGFKRWNLGDPCISRNQLGVWWSERSQRFEVHPNAKAKLKLRLVTWPVSDPDGGATLTPLTERAVLEPGSVLAIGNRCLLLLSRKGLPPFDTDHLNMVGNSEVIWALRERVKTLSRFKETVLILGETGAGKELIAHGLHDASGRKGPFIALNMSSMDPNLANSELFGHKKGAFTGAYRDKSGAFEDAQGGTLFLDEIGDVPLEVQRKLLRVLQDRQFLPIGASAPIDADVRVVAATNKPLRAAIEHGQFRRDLFERLSQLAISVAPLRGRRADIPLLFTHFLAEQTREHTELLWLWADKVQPDPPPVPMTFVLDLMSRRWSGNARELQNVVAATAARNVNNTSFQTPERIRDPETGRTPAPTPWPSSTDAPVRGAPPAELSAGELRRMYREHDYNQARLAEFLGISRPTLIDWLTKAGIKRAVDYSAEDISAALEKVGGDIAQAADLLDVSVRALKLAQSRLESQR